MIIIIITNLINNNWFVSWLMLILNNQQKKQKVVKKDKNQKKVKKDKKSKKKKKKKKKKTDYNNNDNHVYDESEDEEMETKWDEFKTEFVDIGEDGELPQRMCYHRKIMDPPIPHNEKKDSRCCDICDDGVPINWDYYYVCYCHGARTDYCFDHTLV